MLTLRAGIDLVMSSYRIGSNLFLSGKLLITTKLVNDNSVPHYRARRVTNVVRLLMI